MVIQLPRNTISDVVVSLFIKALEENAYLWSFEWSFLLDKRSGLVRTCWGRWLGKCIYTLFSELQLGSNCAMCSGGDWPCTTNSQETLHCGISHFIGKDFWITKYINGIQNQILQTRQKRYICWVAHFLNNLTSSNKKFCILKQRICFAKIIPSAVFVQRLLYWILEGSISFRKIVWMSWEMLVAKSLLQNLCSLSSSGI